MLDKSLTQLFNDPEQQARGYLSWLAGTGGYYYTAFVHDYEGLTINEVNHCEPLLISDIQDYYKHKIKGYNLEKISTTYSNFHKAMTYFVKLGFVTKGKASISIQQIEDKFNITLVFATRTKYSADIGSPNQFRNREPNLTLYPDRSVAKAKRRHKNRLIRKKGKMNKHELEFNKVYTPETKRPKRVRRRYRS